MTQNFEYIGQGLASRFGSPASVSSWLFEELTRRIIVGELPPESRVTEESLVKELGASRTPLREALKQLEELGLIVRQRNRTMRIAPLQTREVVELTKIREHLEGLVASEVAIQVHAKGVPTERLWEIVGHIEAAEKRPGEAFTIFEQGIQFHNHLLMMSGLEKVARILSGVHLGLARYRHVNALDQRRLTQRSVEHRRILQAVESGDPAAAEAEMRSHIREGLRAYTTNLTDGRAASV